MAIYYLLSGGDIKNGMLTEPIRKLLKKDLKGKKKLVAVGAKQNIEANDIYFHGNEDSFGTIKTFSFCDLEQFDLIDIRTPKIEGAKLLREADIIYLQGGNQQIQYNYLVKNGYDQILKEHQGIILGLSAGAMNMGEISFYSERNDYYKGFSFVPLTIDPHFDITNKRRINNALKYSQKFPIIGLPDNSMIRIENDKRTDIGIHYLFEHGTYTTEGEK